MEGVTRESLRPLLDLQRIDSSIDRLHQRRSDLPEQRELDELNAERAEIASGHAEQQASLDTVAREQTKLETEIQQIVDKTEKDQARLYSGEIQNPKELSNIQAELDALRRRKTHLEDQELEVMEQREGLEKEVNDRAISLADLDARIAKVTAARDAASVEIAAELDGLSAERATVTPALPAEVLELYDDVRAKKGGVAVGALDRKTCTACNTVLSPMAVDEIKRSDDPLPRCENCRRILVLV